VEKKRGIAGSPAENSKACLGAAGHPKCGQESREEEQNEMSGEMVLISRMHNTSRQGREEEKAEHRKNFAAVSRMPPNRVKLHPNKLHHPE
jgi:hypothetical protein